MKIVLKKDKTFRVSIRVAEQADGTIRVLQSNRVINRILRNRPTDKDRDAYKSLVTEFEKEFEGRISEEWAEFKRWSYEERGTIHDLSLVPIQTLSDEMRRDETVYRREKFARLFRDWSIKLYDEDGEQETPLLRDDDGSVSEISIKSILEAPELTSIIEAFMVEADAVLEYGEPVEGSDSLGGFRSTNGTDILENTSPLPETTMAVTAE